MSDDRHVTNVRNLVHQATDLLNSETKITEDSSVNLDILRFPRDKEKPDAQSELT